MLERYNLDRQTDRQTDIMVLLICYIFGSSSMQL